eukprot:jgi/Botrbrau1/1682/Bobra.116_2s0026.1
MLAALAITLIFKAVSHDGLHIQEYSGCSYTTVAHSMKPSELQAIKVAPFTDTPCHDRSKVSTDPLLPPTQKLLHILFDIQKCSTDSTPQARICPFEHAQTVKGVHGVM